jgi:serine/threonine protein kinase
MILQPGQTVGTYHISELLGSGGMSNVYKAYQSGLERYVALKVLNPDTQHDPNFRTRFQREATLVARLDHPHIVPVYDFNQHQDFFYLVMKHVEGQTLSQLRAGGPLKVAQIFDLLTPIAEALTYAHQQGVVHRDIKPSNILIDAQSKPYLADFGLAQQSQNTASTISVGSVLGTPHYFAPEQAANENITARTDVYSFAVMLYELLVGRLPFDSNKTPIALIYDHMYTVPPRPSQLNPLLPPALDAIFARALAKNPLERPSSALDLLEAVRTVLVARPAPAPSGEAVVSLSELQSALAYLAEKWGNAAEQQAQRATPEGTAAAHAYHLALDDLQLLQHALAHPHDAQTPPPPPQFLRMELGAVQAILSAAGLRTTQLYEEDQRIFTAIFPKMSTITQAERSQRLMAADARIVVLLAQRLAQTGEPYLEFAFAAPEATA